MLKELRHLLDENKAVLLIILAFVFVATFSARGSTWDPAVYVGMGKHIYSSGQVGLWEPARPIMLPLILGLFWKAGLNPFATGAFFSLLLAAAAIFFVYMTIKGLCSNSKAAAIAFSLLFAANFALVTYSNSILTDIPAMFFSLAAVYLAIKNRFFPAGLLVGVAVLTKFTSLFLLPAILAGIFLNKERLAAAKQFILGLAVVAIPYLVANTIIYKDPLYPLAAGQRLIQSVVGNYTCPASALFYVKLAAAEVPLLLISIVALFIAAKERNWKLTMVSLAAVVPLAYHSFFLHCKDVRYAFAFLPYFYALAAYAFHKALGQRRKLAKYSMVALVAAQLALSTGILGYHIMNKEPQWKLNPEFYKFLETHNVAGKVWASTPEVMGSANVRIDELVYYPVFDDSKMDELNARLNEKIQYILINTCDIPCVNYDADCPERRQEFLNQLPKRFGTAFNATEGNCELTIYEGK